MTTSPSDSFGAFSDLQVSMGTVRIARLARLTEQKVGRVERLPFSVKILLESLLRNVDGFKVTADDVRLLASWDPKSPPSKEIPFMPGRVVLQDFTGVPCLVDLAALRDAIRRAGGDPKKINPLVPCDLVIDHSVQVDAFGTPEALAVNSRYEFERNRERYEFLRWGSKAFDNFRLVPPATGIVHQVNLEFLASVVMTKKENGRTWAFPDSLVGTDSHTTMINGLGVLGWGVGGIEAEAVMLGQPMAMLPPAVIGFKLSGALKEGVTATDLVLTVTQILRAKGVVGKFVEFFGPGLSSLSLPDRATIANMCPEYGATAAYFPVDQETLEYLRLTGRPAGLIDLVERYTKEQGLFRTDSTPPPDFSEVMELKLETVESSLAGPKRPQDRVSLSNSKQDFQKALSSFLEGKKAAAPNGGDVGHGSVVIAAITSCTNTSNPSVMVGAGLVAKKAVERGLTVKPYVKTSLAPGSQVVTDYLKNAGLTPYLEKLGFYTVGYGCTTCIGNSGPLPEAVSKVIKEKDLVVAGVLSGNRNFEGRIHPQVKANYLASPMLVVAYALAGTMNVDLTKEPIGTDAQGNKVYLKEIWPTQQEIRQAIAKSVTAEAFQNRYSNVFEGPPEWKAIPTPTGDLYKWDEKSTYVQEPPYFLNFPKDPLPVRPILKARVLEFLGDSITTDHISPAGSIAKDSPAGQFLLARGVEQKDFNSYGARRGNDRVMSRGTFANVRIKNRLVPGAEGWWTTHLPSGEKMTVFEAAERYRKEGVPLLVIAGTEYGSGSSRDWAAKGPALLGVKAVIAESFERIHRSNLIGMGILPLEFLAGENADSLKLTGTESFDITGLNDNLKPGQTFEVKATAPDGNTVSFKAKTRIDTPVEVEYYRHGGILHYVLRQILKSA
ncbi:MAG: aconitate hydratase AcnA [Candidatus Omnitrophica bacterium]|nr:aconitate hydratase AcnA [Candidatus Omnitrophota bacterium]